MNGSITLSEQNFDLFRYPRSVQDIIDGTAFRGGGQQFRLEALPGNQFSRYTINWADPYFLDTNWSLGTSGFYYSATSRIGPNTAKAADSASAGNSIRSGPLRGVAFGKRQPDESHDPDAQILKDSLGDNLLSTARFSVVNDTRDSAFLPGEGHRLSLAFEQAFGQFIFPAWTSTAPSISRCTAGRTEADGNSVAQHHLGVDRPAYPVSERLLCRGLSNLSRFLLPRRRAGSTARTRRRPVRIFGIG